MLLTDEEKKVCEEFKVDPAAQDEVRREMGKEGTDYGKMYSDIVYREVSLKTMLSNSGRCAAADIISLELEKMAGRLRLIGYDARNVDIFISAAKSELSWLIGDV